MCERVCVFRTWLLLITSTHVCAWKKYPIILCGPRTTRPVSTNLSSHWRKALIIISWYVCPANLFQGLPSSHIDWRDRNRPSCIGVLPFFTCTATSFFACGSKKKKLFAENEDDDYQNTRKRLSSESFLSHNVDRFSTEATETHSKRDTVRSKAFKL